MSVTISQYIRRDLLCRLGGDDAATIDLSLASLSRHYGVSFTPVREALRSLVAEGVLQRQGNGTVRAEPSRRPADTPPVADEPPARSETLEAALAADVIARSLRGASDYLREEATARRFDVGRTAIRQALGRLAGRGLIEHVPRCGWRIRPFDAADLDAYLQVREVLELKALELARPHLDPAVLKRMLARNAPGGETPSLDNDIHAYLIATAGNPYIREFFERQGPYYTSLLDFAAPETHLVATMARQHRAILRALIARDWPRARRELARHIRAQRPIMRRLMDRIERARTQPES
jgi:DNA-binding GntR family transcriptional regulator